jgi:predicted P-loop ATPase
MTAADIAAKLGNPSDEGGGSWRCDCPTCAHHTLSLRDGSRKLLAKCWNGCTTKDVYAALRDRGFTTPRRKNGLDGDLPPETRAEHEAKAKSGKAKREARIAAALDVWNNAVPINNTMVETYLAGRLCNASPPTPPTLRFAPSVWSGKAGLARPAIVGLIQHETEGAIGVHLIALNPLDASVKVASEPRKWSLGPVKGGAVRLADAGPVLALAEGIEDALTFMLATEIPAWAAITTAGMRSFVSPPLETTSTLILIEDQDKNQAGQRAVADAARRLSGRGYQIRIARPKGGKDLNDALHALGPGAALFDIEDYQPSRAGDWYSRCLAGSDGQTLSNFANAVLALRDDPAWRGVLAFDEMFASAFLLRPSPGETATPAQFPRPISDNDASRAQEWLQLVGLPCIGKDATHQAIEFVAYENRYHSVRRYLEGLVWDHTERLDDWLADCLGVEKTEYAMAVGRMFLIAMAARIFDPGCQADYMLILEGPQSTQKSTACRILGGEWFSDDLPPNVASRDAALHLRGKWLVEIAELHSFSRSEVAALKAFLTRRIDIYRPPYGRKDLHQPRQCMFIGTVNERVYLTDPTGGRRFWPVVTGEIDIDLLASWRDQLFAEALARYRRSEKWWPGAEFESRHITSEQEQRYEADAWEEPITDYLGSKTESTVFEVARQGLGFTADKIATHDQRRITNILQRLGWARGTRQATRRPWVKAGR